MREMLLVTITLSIIILSFLMIALIVGADKSKTLAEKEREDKEQMEWMETNVNHKPKE